MMEKVNLNLGKKFKIKFIFRLLLSDLDSATDRSVSTQPRKMSRSWDALFNSVSLLPLTQISKSSYVFQKNSI